MSATEESRCNLYMHREALAWAPQKKRLPVTLVTGFLGSGKTTLLTYILNNKANLKIAAAVNDFASLNIDSQIVRGVVGGKEGVVELSNGCLCCSVSGEFRKAVWALLQDADIGKIDYLVVETSGVTDPLKTISVLEEEYGQMYRVRLDVVVTVVDTDYLSSRLQDDTLSRSVAADSQLKCADVILLNKRDLVTEAELENVKSYLASHVPGAAIYPCRYGAVPLHWILEVSEVPRGPQLVSHEATTSAYTINSVGGVKNVARKGRALGGGGEDHLSADEFESIVFESPSPLSLSSFQGFLGSGFPESVTRMKGTVWFSEARSCLYSFHMSGRNRYEVTPQETGFGGPRKVELVMIGRGEMESVLKLLEDCVHQENRAESLQANEGNRLQTVCNLIKKHDYFVIEEEEKEEGETSDISYVDFRVSGVIDYGVTEEEASGFHGINFGKMNREVALRLNGSSERVSVLPVLLPNGVQVLRHSVSAEAGFEETWRVLVPIAEKVVSDVFRSVGVCKCGR